MLRIDIQLQNLVDSLRDSLQNSHDIYSLVKVVSANENNNEPCFFCKSHTCTNCVELDDIGEFKLSSFLYEHAGPQFNSNNQLFVPNFSQGIVYSTEQGLACFGIEVYVDISKQESAAWKNYRSFMTSCTEIDTGLGPAVVEIGLTLSKCFDEFKKPEQLSIHDSWKCTNCKQNV